MSIGGTVVLHVVQHVLRCELASSAFRLSGHVNLARLRVHERDIDGAGLVSHRVVGSKVEAGTLVVDSAQWRAR